MILLDEPLASIDELDIRCSGQGNDARWAAPFNSVVSNKEGPVSFTVAEDGFH